LYKIGEMGRDEAGEKIFPERRINSWDAFSKRGSLIP